MPDKTEFVGTDHLIAIAAFRYALGRMSYMVDHVATWLEENADVMDPATRRLIIQEIDQQAKSGSLGMDMDAERWRCVQDRLRAAGVGDE